jgi:hypothetical protein
VLTNCAKSGILDNDGVDKFCLGIHADGNPGVLCIVGAMRRGELALGVLENGEPAVDGFSGGVC